MYSFPGVDPRQLEEALEKEIVKQGCPSGERSLNEVDILLFL